METKFFDNIGTCVDHVFEVCGKKVVLGLPLALGKPQAFVNEVYRRAKADPSIQLIIATALSLEKPAASGELERRILGPMADRIWAGVPDLDYMTDLRKNALPPNVVLKEFYFKAGALLHHPPSQQNHCSSNYTHVVRDMVTELLDEKPDWALVYCQGVARRELDGRVCYSESCNADLGPDLKRWFPRLGRKNIPHLRIAVVNNQLPFMYGEAVNPAGTYDAIIDNPEYETPLFSVPSRPVSVPDHAIGLNVSTLIRDGGTLQVGIGSLGDAIAASLLLRHRQPRLYREIVDGMRIAENYQPLVDRIGGLDPFEQGLYGATEMLVDTFIDLYRGGILRRQVYADPFIQKAVNDGLLQEAITPDAARNVLEAIAGVQPVMTARQFDRLRECGFFKPGLRYADDRIMDDNDTFSADLRDEEAKSRILAECVGDRLRNGIVAHGCFFIGPKRFYDALRGMSEEARRQFSMTGVSYVNQLYGDQELKELQRRDARFVNAAMMITLAGNIVSDALADGRVISGVGGQYNFVAMAHALEGARLIMMIKSVREGGRRVASNIVFNYGYATIPRHLRDIVVTEYGIADLRGKMDRDVAMALIQIADSRFQDGLLARARKAGKIPVSYRIPDRFRNNYPEALADKLAPYRKQGLFAAFPGGTELTAEEVALGGALRRFRQKAGRNPLAVAAVVAGRMFSPAPPAADPYLQRMRLDHPVDLKERLLRGIVLAALAADGKI
ncbi:MAG: acetyl-CoA hydrolase/transferase C-terminal domain-containing protein [Thermodesulfobacteriota bacterium]